MLNIQDVGTNGQIENILAKDSKMKKLANFDPTKVVKVNLKKLMQNSGQLEESLDHKMSTSMRSEDSNEIMNNSVEDSMIRKIPLPPMNYSYETTKYPAFRSQIPKAR
jgi:hypothetical protein